MHPVREEPSTKCTEIDTADHKSAGGPLVIQHVKIAFPADIHFGIVNDIQSNHRVFGGSRGDSLRKIQYRTLNANMRLS